MNNSNTSVQQVKRRKPKSLDRKKAKMGWLFVAPFVIGFLFIYAPMIIDSLKYSFGEILINPKKGGFTLEWVGLQNYKYAILEDTGYVPALIAGLKELVFDIPAIVIFSLFIAILLNQKMVGRAAFRAIFFIPVIVSTGIIESIDLANSLESAMSSSSSINTGGGASAGTGAQVIEAMDVQRFFASMKVGTGLVNYVTDMVNDVYNIINRSGVQMLVFLSGLQSISPAIYESCFMEGASAWETFWKITFPMITPMILVNTVYTVIDSFTSQTNGVMKYISGIYESKGTVEATAMSWMYFLIVILILAAVAGILSAFVFYQRRD